MKGRWLKCTLAALGRRALREASSNPYPQSVWPNWLCVVQLRTQSSLINGGNGCDQSKVGTGEQGSTAKCEEGGEEEEDGETDAR